jgi:hypothetical protein
MTFGARASASLATVGRQLCPPTPRAEVFETYWRFAAERHRIFEARLQDPTGPWTTDEVLATYRFCNTFRASDRVTQDLIRVAYETREARPEDLFVRVLIHRLFSKPSTWSLIDRASGGLSAATFDEHGIGALLDEARGIGTTLYTGAFILCATRAYGHPRKHRNHLALVADMLEQDVPDRIRSASSLQTVFNELRRWPLLGPFMSYQLAIDLNYTTLLNFDEDDFTVPGPGALRGLKKVFVNLGDLTPAEAVHWLVEYQYVAEEHLSITPPRLFGRPLHAIDCQNLLCEVDKYCRVAFPQLTSSRTRIKQRFAPQCDPVALFYPPKWRINTPSRTLARAA